MKIGIYGDSYAEILNNGYGQYAWVYRVKECYKDVNIMSKSGTSVYWSYDSLTQTYAEFDKIIFVMTQASRVSIAEFPEATPWFIQHELKNKNLPFDLKQKYQALLDYYLYISMDNAVNRKEALFYELVSQQILQLPVPVMIIPAFAVNYFNGQRKLGLYNVSQMEQDHWGKKWKKFLKTQHQSIIKDPRVDHRQCHMSNANNAILFDKINSILPTLDHGIELPIELDDFVLPDEFENYVFAPE